MHWPAGWAEQNLPSLQRLKRNGLYFLRAYTAACECSPSRGVMQTGRFAPINRVASTAVLWPGLMHQDRQPTMPPSSRRTPVTTWCGRASGT